MNLVKWSSLFNQWINLGSKAIGSGDYILEGGDFSDADFNLDFFVWPQLKLNVSKLVETPKQYSWHQIEDFHTGLKTGDAVFSIFAKKADRSYLKLSTLSMYKGVYDVDAVFDLSAGTLLEGSGGIIPLDDGWYRCYVTDNVKSINPFGLRVMILNDELRDDYMGELNKGIYIAAAQFEYGNLPTSHEATMGYPV